MNLNALCVLAETDIVVEINYSTGRDQRSQTSTHNDAANWQTQQSLGIRPGKGSWMTQNAMHKIQPLSCWATQTVAKMSVV